MKKREQYYTKAKVNTFLGVVSTGLSVVLSAAIIPLLILRFGADNWARYAFFLLYVAVLTFIESALQLYSLQKTATASATATEYRWAADGKVGLVFVGVLLLGGLAVGFNEFHGLTKDADLRHLLLLAFINVFPRGVSAVVKGAMLGLSSQARYYAVSTALNLGRPLFLLLVLLILSPGVVTLAVLYVAFSFFEMGIYLAIDKPGGAGSADSSRHEVDANLMQSLLLSNGFSVLAGNLDKILVFISMSLALAGEYTFASAVAGLLYMFVNAAISAFGPKFKELFIHGERQETLLHLYGISFINNMLVLLAISAFYFTGEYLLRAMSVELNLANAMQTFLILAGACLLSSNLWIPGMIATSSGQASFSVKTNLIFVVVYVAVFYGFASRWGQVAFSLSMLLSAAVTTVFGMLYFKHRVFDLSIARYALISVCVPVLVVAIVSIPLWGLDSRFKLLWVNISYLAIFGAATLIFLVRARNVLEGRFRTFLVKT